MSIPVYGFLQTRPDFELKNYMICWYVPVWIISKKLFWRSGTGGCNFAADNGFSAMLIICEQTKKPRPT